MMLRQISFFLMLLIWLPSHPRAHAAAQADLPEGILIEAELFDQKSSAEKEFANVFADANASGRAALTRFFLKGSCTYHFKVTVAGEYLVWLRYASNNPVKVRAGIDVAGPAQCAPAALEGSGSLDGPNAYRWGKLFQKKLSAGAHTLLLASGTFRPDCMLLTSSKDAPRADLKARPKPLDEKTRALLAKPLEPIRPDWLDGAKDYELPAWYDQWRVCAHTRLGPPWHDKPIFLSAGQAFATLGFHVFSRHIKSGGEGAWWPSAEGEIVEWAKGKNYAKEILDEAHAAGERIIVYNRHMEDEAMARQHPDWVCVDWRGKPLETNRGAIMCMNSPYADYFNRRQLELVDLGADGFFYDEIHMPKTGCWCAYCKKKFQEETGLDHPAQADPENPVWNRLIDFNNATIERTFLKWRAALHARNPQVVMLLGSHKYPQMTERHLTQRLFRIADSMKTEFSLPIRGEFSPNASRKQSSALANFQMPLPPDVRLALGYDLSRDAADGRPAHIWAHGLLDARSAVFATAGMIAHGCIANLDNDEKTIPDAARFKPAVELGNRVSPGLAGTRPLHWAAIHYAEAARDAYLPDETETWEKVLYPMVAGYMTLLRAHLPVGVVTDSQLEEGRLEGYKVLFLPAPEQLTPAMKSAVEQFKNGGGVVVEQRPDWTWWDILGYPKAAAAFMKEIAGAAGKAPVAVSGGSAKMQTVAFEGRKDKRITVALTNDFSWVHTGRAPTPEERRRIDAAGAAVRPCTGVKITLRGRGAPKKVTELAGGKELSWSERGGAGDIEIDVPEFEALAVVVTEY